MTKYLRGPLFRTWLWLVAATVLSALLGLEAGALAVLAIALFKCRLVMRTYMEVRSAPRWLQRACDGWLLCNGLMLSSYYWL